MEIQFIKTDPRAVLPASQTFGSAGLDLRALLPEGVESITLMPGDQIMVETGLRVWIKDHNYAGFMFARSGTGTKGLVLGNGTGVIDADYQGPLKICLWNRGDNIIQVASGDRVAQMVLMPVASGYTLREVEAFDEDTVRGQGGFGSTGVK